MGVSRQCGRASVRQRQEEGERVRSQMTSSPGMSWARGIEETTGTTGMVRWSDVAMGPTGGSDHMGHCAAHW